MKPPSICTKRAGGSVGKAALTSAWGLLLLIEITDGDTRTLGARITGYGSRVSVLAGRDDGFVCVSVTIGRLLSVHGER